MSISKLALRTMVSDAIEDGKSLELQADELPVLMSIFRLAESKSDVTPGSKMMPMRNNLGPHDVLSGTPLQEAYHSLLLAVTRVILQSNTEFDVREDLMKAVHDSLKVAI